MKLFEKLLGKKRRKEILIEKMSPKKMSAIELMANRTSKIIPDYVELGIREYLLKRKIGINSFMELSNICLCTNMARLNNRISEENAKELRKQVWELENRDFYSSMRIYETNVISDEIETIIQDVFQ